MAYNRRKNGRVYTYYRCLRDSKRAERTCPVREVAAPVVDELVRRQLTAALRSPQVLGALEEKSGMEAADVLKTLDGDFWKEATSAECRRIVELLVAEAVLTTDRLVLELNTEGINSIMEEIENESNQD